ncbi:hypothetical protein KVR01_002535 [Diaporthe batatas]|uniref:uncharacterized protein n=1 Tax=Diaporthe batatas TaxID=748121 RepID=UPI001D03C20C|nr:uncharacterized protein KVR01_002535 [Diaporthe batatas]KAG8166846.1 hypothetical protein KVR01_002535 [Diaporthe batatas]
MRTFRRIKSHNLRPHLHLSQSLTNAARCVTMSANTAKQPATAKNAKDSHKPAVEKKELKILMLHGYAQTGPLFRSKTGAMSKLMAKALPDVNASRIYPTGPQKLQPSDIPGFQPRDGAEGEEAPETFGWFYHDEEAGPYRGFDVGMRAVADAIEDAGGVDGVLAFSQGAAVAALVAAAMEPDRALPEDPAQRAWVLRLREANGGRPLRFCILYSGFVARPGAGLGWLYEGRIKTPSCHFFGSLDTVVAEERCRALADHFVDPEAFVHPGGHHVPVRKEWVAPLTGFLKHVLEKEAAATATS